MDHDSSPQARCLPESFSHSSNPEPRYAGCGECTVEVRSRSSSWPAMIKTSVPHTTCKSHQGLGQERFRPGGRPLTATGAGGDIPADRQIPLRRNRDQVDPSQLFLFSGSSIASVHGLRIHQPGGMAESDDIRSAIATLKASCDTAPAVK